MATATSRFGAYLQLIRFNRPIGTLLLLWPTLWALWLATDEAKFVTGQKMKVDAGRMLK